MARMTAMAHDFYSRSPVSTDMSPLLEPRVEEVAALRRSLVGMDAQLLRLLSARMALCQQMAKAAAVAGQTGA